MAERDLGVIPSVQDLLAGGVLVVTYYLRLGLVAEPGATVPDLLVITTDFVIPVVAASWVWVAAMFLLIERAGRKE